MGSTVWNTARSQEQDTGLWQCCVKHRVKPRTRSGAYAALYEKARIAKNKSQRLCGKKKCAAPHFGLSVACKQTSSNLQALEQLCRCLEEVPPAKVLWQQSCATPPANLRPPPLQGAAAVEMCRWPPLSALTIPWTLILNLDPNLVLTLTPYLTLTLTLT